MQNMLAGKVSGLRATQLFVSWCAECKTAYHAMQEISNSAEALLTDLMEFLRAATVWTLLSLASSY